MQVKCPTCKKMVEYSPKNPFRPFCSERCKLIDLGEWATDGYVIEGEPGSADRLSPEGVDEAARYRAELDRKKARQS